MDCNDTTRFLDAAVDGELDLVHHVELERHLSICPTCRERADNIRRQRDSLREKLPRFTAAPLFAEKIRGSLHAESAVTSNAEPGKPVAHHRPLNTNIIRFRFWNFTAIAASIAAALLLGIALGNRHAHDRFLFDEALSDHIRSLQLGHLTDVVSTDQHTVKPWFAGKLDFSPPVVDVAEAGYPLAGGRLEHIDGRNAAALVYRRRQHAVNLFIWPSNEAALGPHLAKRDGFHLQAWSQNGFNFLAVSEIPASELAHFSEMFQSSLSAP